MARFMMPALPMAGVSITFVMRSKRFNSNGWLRVLKRTCATRTSLPHSSGCISAQIASVTGPKDGHDRTALQQTIFHLDRFELFTLLRLYSREQSLFIPQY
eukprot:SAG31_NODE_177_length_21310_cov_8.894064_14_plen_101_part_00